MRSLRFFLPLALAAFLVPVLAAAQAPQAQMGYGVTSPQVLLLQQELNRWPATQVAAEGPGAPGQETTYFGGKTLAAVRLFQGLHGVPQTGYVGPLTLAALMQLDASATTVTSASATSSPAATSSAMTPVADSPLEQYIAAVMQGGAQSGLSAQTLALVATKIRSEAATSTDFRAQFFKEQQLLYQKHNAFLNKIMDSLASLLLPGVAQAGTGLPFGGYVTYVNPLICDCTPGVTQIFVSLPSATPTSNLLLNYIDGTEAFEWYNLPMPGVATLGSYTPGGEACWTYVGHACVPVPAVGVIMPMTGSSAVPL